MNTHFLPVHIVPQKEEEDSVYTLTPFLLLSVSIGAHAPQVTKERRTAVVLATTTQPLLETKKIALLAHIKRSIVDKRKGRTATGKLKIEW